mmetsp:Transcript_118173/g.185646  ORF Transcript_118173/g.185646 Transcript_118173/m.185646 type:complete len:242 (+) Transcript_118173:192-917(+)
MRTPPDHLAERILICRMKSILGCIMSKDTRIVQEMVLQAINSRMLLMTEIVRDIYLMLERQLVTVILGGILTIGSDYGRIRDARTICEMCQEAFISAATLTIGSDYERIRDTRTTCGMKLEATISVAMPMIGIDYETIGMKLEAIISVAMPMTRIDYEKIGMYLEVIITVVTLMIWIDYVRIQATCMIYKKMVVEASTLEWILTTLTDHERIRDSRKTSVIEVMIEQGREMIRDVSMVCEM